MTQSGTGLNKRASWLSRLGVGRVCVALGLALSLAACNNSPYPVGAADLRLAAHRSLQELARLSDLSPRFLSEMEAGRGNISVARLARVADALERPIQSLIPVPKADLSLRGRVWEWVENCPPEDLEALYHWLSARQREPTPPPIPFVRFP